MINRIRILYAVTVLLAGLMTACSPGGEGPSTANHNTAQPSSNPQQVAVPAPSNKTPTPPLPQAVPDQVPASATNAAKPVDVKPAPSGPAPKLFLPIAKIDFGKQAKGKTLVRAITIKNVGNAELKIESVVPS
jgi:hypothetical protein